MDGANNNWRQELSDIIVIKPVWKLLTSTPVSVIDARWTGQVLSHHSKYVNPDIGCTLNNR